MATPSACPNCGIDINGQPTLGFIEYAEGYGIAVCNCCISHPEKLDSNRIGHAMRLIPAHVRYLQKEIEILQKRT